MSFRALPISLWTSGQHASNIESGKEGGGRGRGGGGHRVGVGGGGWGWGTSLYDWVFSKTNAVALAMC